jgi:hypothetical protein
MHGHWGRGHLSAAPWIFKKVGNILNNIKQWPHVTLVVDFMGDAM